MKSRANLHVVTTLEPVNAHERYLSEREIGEEYPGLISIALLRRFRLEKKGPAWLKIGRTVRYPKSAIDQFIQESKAGG